jgi:hypothetical protein
MVGGWFDAYDAFLASEEYAKESRRADKYDQTECCDTRAIISF